MYKVLSENISSAVSVSGELITLSTVHAVTHAAHLSCLGSSVAENRVQIPPEAAHLCWVSLYCVVIVPLYMYMHVHVQIYMYMYMYITDFLYCCTSSVLTCLYTCTCTSCVSTCMWQHMYIYICYILKYSMYNV